jgi:type III pantothenate kinase
MNLIIDVGNTFVKLAVFDNEMIAYKKSCIKNDFLHEIKVISKLHLSIKDVIVSSVGEFTDSEMLALKNNFKLFDLSHKAKIPFKNMYATPETLGVDRIALVSAAAIQFPKKNVLIIDVGSCITYDFLNAENEYLGGAISPGIELRYKSLHNYTEKLPLLKPKKTNKLTGDSTEESIHIGVLQGVISEIDACISSYKNKFEELTIILTGGGALYLVDSLKNDIFANSNFLLEGLNYILENNKNKC